MAKKPGCERVYDAASQWVDVALRNDDSLFTPGISIWSLPNLDDFYNRFVLQPDESSDSFEVKFKAPVVRCPARDYPVGGGDSLRSSFASHTSSDGWKKEAGTHQPRSIVG